HWPLISARFDTIIIDEAQDFSPAWIALLQALLDPDGRRRVLVLADEGQGIYERGFVFPEPDDGWVQVELASNFRNARPIARLLRNHLGGAPAPLQSPEGLGVVWIEANDIDAVEDAVDRELERIVENEGRSSAGVCVGTVRSKVRDHLRSALHLVRWEDRERGAVLCENVHRLKGLEFDTVILAATGDIKPDEEALLYVGVSRAVSELIVIGPRAFADRLGLVRD
ncbi:MAG: ATP-binding domain-containing protein, partial [Acidobacteria bacterium]|nr:ATP-binding domain-containing protein [Acidobacteriota bacterium]